MEPVDPEQLATERRRPGRRAVHLDARFQAGDSGPFPCVVTDYSPQDQMLHIDALQSVNHLAGCAEGELWLEGTADSPAMKVHVAIRRVEHRGLAVFVGEPDAALVSRLEAGAGIVLPNPGEIEQRQRSFAPMFHALLPAASTLIARGASQLATEFTERAEGALLDALRDARNNRDQQRLDAALTRLARFRSAWVRQVSDTMVHALALLDDPLRYEASGGANGGTGLSLVELTEFEDYLAVSRVAGVLAQGLEEPLFALRRRLELLAGHEFSDDDNPLGPRMFCSAFANALKGHVDDSSVNELLFTAMHETLELGLPEFYAALNALLVQHGVLGRVEREKPNIRRQPAREGRPGVDPFGQADAVGSEGIGQWSGATGNLPQRGHAELQAVGRAGARPLGSLRDQLHLSRLFAAPAQTEDNAPEYSTGELVSGLEELQNLFTRTGGLAALDPGSVRQQLLAHLQRSGAPTKSLGQSASDGLELVGSLFQSLLGDAALGAAARTHLPRLQPLLNRAALEDGALLDSTQHPLLRVVDRVAQLDATLDGTQEQRLQEILDRLGHADGAAPVDSVLTELEALVENQGAVYAKAVAETVRVAEEQQKVLRERRELSGDPPPPEPTFPEELARWVDRARALKPGARVTLNTSGRALALTLAWVAEAHAAYLFVDGRGHKAASLTLQQVVVYLRRGLLKLVSDAPGSAVDRALFGVVDRMHRKLIEEATEDPLTGLYTRKAFLREVEARLPLPQTEPTETEGVMCEISFENLRDINESAGTEHGDELIRALSAKLAETNPGEDNVLGRMGGGEWGLYLTRGGEKTALKSMRALLPSLEATRLAAAPDLAPRLACGIAGVDSQSPLVEPMLRAARTAREHAARSGGEGIALAGADERRRQQITQLMAYVPKALARNRLVLMHHEIRPLDISELPAARILLAAEDRGGKLIPPALFSPAVAGTHSAFDIDLWMLRALLGWIDAMPGEADRYSAFVVPLSRASLQTEGIAHLIVNEFMNHPVPPSRIRFEIEDAVAHSRLAECVELVGSLREFGCRFVLGDFSGEHDDNAYLRELAIDFIELAPRFTAELREDPRDIAITRSINELAHFMGRRTIARVDATPEIQRALRQMRVDYIHDTSRETRLQVNANG